MARNEQKAQLRKEIRQELVVRTDINAEFTIPELLLNSQDYFVLHANQLWYLDKIKNAMCNQTRSAIVEKIIKNSVLYTKIVAMRRNQNEDKKKTAEVIKKALKECGWTEESVTKERDSILNTDKSYQALEIAKVELSKKLEEYLLTQPIYSNWLKQIRGIDVLIAAKLLKTVGDIRRFDKPSSLWHYFGYHVENGKAPKLKHGEQATFNVRNRALGYLIAKGQVMTRGPYREVHDDYKAKDAQKHPDYPKYYLQNRALRKLAKTFLLDFWIASYQALGLEPPRKPYSARFHPNEDYKPVVQYQG